MVIDQTLTEEIIRRILRVTRPERIILFGSAATGQMTYDSDIDLLILESAPANVRDERVRIREALRGLGRPFDVIVMATERFEESKNVIGGIAADDDWTAGWTDCPRDRRVARRACAASSAPPIRGHGYLPAPRGAKIIAA